MSLEFPSTIGTSQCELVGPELGPAWGWIQRCFHGINLSQALLPGPPAVLNSPLTGTGLKSAPAFILNAFGWAESFPGSARISLKATNGRPCDHLLHRFLHSKESHPGPQRASFVLIFLSLKSWEDPPVSQGFVWRWWDILGDNIWATQYCPVDDRCATSRHSELNWTTQNKKGKPKADLSQSLIQTKLPLPCWAQSGCDLSVF